MNERRRILMAKRKLQDDRPFDLLFDNVTIPEDVYDNNAFPTYLNTMDNDVADLLEQMTGSSNLLWRRYGNAYIFIKPNTDEDITITDGVDDYTVSPTDAESAEDDIQLQNQHADLGLCTLVDFYSGAGFNIYTVKDYMLSGADGSVKYFTGFIVEVDFTNNKTVEISCGDFVEVYEFVNTPYSHVYKFDICDMGMDSRLARATLTGKVDEEDTGVYIPQIAPLDMMEARYPDFGLHLQPADPNEDTLSDKALNDPDTLLFRIEYSPTGNAVLDTIVNQCGEDYVSGEYGSNREYCVDDILDAIEEEFGSGYMDSNDVEDILFHHYLPLFSEECGLADGIESLKVYYEEGGAMGGLQLTDTSAYPNLAVYLTESLIQHTTYPKTGSFTLVINQALCTEQLGTSSIEDIVERIELSLTDSDLENPANPYSNEADYLALFWEHAVLYS